MQATHNFQKIVYPTRIPRQELLQYRKKNEEFPIFSVKETDVSPNGQYPVNRVGDQYTGSPVMPVFSGLQVPGDPGNCRARTRFLNEIPVTFFLQNILQLHLQR